MAPGEIREEALGRPGSLNAFGDTGPRLSLRLDFAAASFLLELVQEMILDRPRLNRLFRRLARISSFIIGLWPCLHLYEGLAAETMPRVQVFTKAQQILDLGPEKARSTPYPAVITGVLTFPVPGRTTAFVQDESAGIMVIYTNANVQPASGE